MLLCCLASWSPQMSSLEWNHLQRFEARKRTFWQWGLHQNHWLRPFQARSVDKQRRPHLLLLWYTRVPRPRNYLRGWPWQSSWLVESCKFIKVCYSKYFDCFRVPCSMRCYVEDLLITRKIESRWCMTLWMCQSKCSVTFRPRQDRCWQVFWTETKLKDWGPLRMMPAT